VQTYRTRLTPGDPDRATTLLWSLAGVPPGDPTFQPANGPAVRLAASSCARGPWADPYARAVTLPADAPPGRGWILFGTERAAEVEVLARPKARTTSTVTPASTSPVAVEKILRDGKTCVLAPGRHVWGRAVTLPPGARVEAYGARITRLPDGDYGERMFVGGQDATILGATLEPAMLAFHADPAVTGLVLRDVTLVNGILGYGHGQCLFADCLFDRAGCLYAPPGLYARCRWRDNPAGAHAFWGGNYPGTLALVDCDFDGTGRGPCFGTNLGSVADCLFAGTTCRGINRDDNGNEIFLCEGQDSTKEYSRNLHVHTRVASCDSNLFQLGDCPARDNLFLDTVMDGGGGLWVAGGNDAPQTGNVTDGFELRGTGGITLGWTDGNGRVHGRGVAGNVWRNGAVIGFRPTRVNQGYYRPDFYERNVAVLALPGVGAGNGLENVSYVDLPPGVVGARGLSETNCRVVRGAGAA
jgi:hypothetical protein